MAFIAYSKFGHAMAQYSGIKAALGSLYIALLYIRSNREAVHKKERKQRVEIGADLKDNRIGRDRRPRYDRLKRGCKEPVCSTNSPQPCLDPPKSELHDGQRRINEAGKCSRENTSFWTILRGGVRVQACHAAV